MLKELLWTLCSSFGFAADFVALRSSARTATLARRLSIIIDILTDISAMSAGGARRLGAKIGHYDKSVDLTA